MIETESCLAHDPFIHVVKGVPVVIALVCNVLFPSNHDAEALPRLSKSNQNE